MNWETQCKQKSFYLGQMEKRIPKDDALRIIDEKVDFSFINELAKPYYSRLGPIGYSPERLFRMLIVMYMANIPSERKLVEELNVNIKYMWFTRTDLDSPIPDHSTFSVLRSRLTDKVFKEIFERIVSVIIDLGVAHPRSISVDSTSVLADVKFPRKDDKDSVMGYKHILSPNDPDARYGHTAKTTGFFGYKAEMMVDNDSSTILNIDAKPGNIDDYKLEKGFVEEPIKNNIRPIEAALDRGYDSYKVRRLLKDNNIKTAIPIRVHKYDHLDLYKVDAFKIDLENKKVTCPAGEELEYAGYEKRKSNHMFVGIKCRKCKLRERCTRYPLRQLYVNQDYLLKQEAIAFNSTEEYRAIFKKRSCVERVIGEAKRFHGMMRAKFRRLWKLRIQCYLTAIVINLKRTARFFIEQQEGILMARAGP